MSRTPPPRPPMLIKAALSDIGRARVTEIYATVYAAATGFGMSRTACSDYARHAVKDCSDLIQEIDEEMRRTTPKQFGGDLDEEPTNG